MATPAFATGDRHVTAFNNIASVYNGPVGSVGGTPAATLNYIMSSPPNASVCYEFDVPNGTTTDTISANVNATESNTVAGFQGYPFQWMSLTTSLIYNATAALPPVKSYQQTIIMTSGNSVPQKICTDVLFAAQVSITISATGSDTVQLIVTANIIPNVSAFSSATGGGGGGGGSGCVVPGTAGSLLFDTGTGCNDAAWHYTASGILGGPDLNLLANDLGGVYQTNSAGTRQSFSGMLSGFPVRYLSAGTSPGLRAPYSVEVIDSGAA